MEKLKKNRKKFIVSAIVISVISFIGLILIGVLINNVDIVIPLVVLILFFSILSIFILYNYMVKRPYKMEYISSVLKEYKPTIKYSYKFDSDFYKELIKDYRIIPSATSFNFKDKIEDEILGYNYISCDLHATHTQSTGKTTTTITDFLGKVYDIKVEDNYCDYILKEEKWKREPEGFDFLDLEVIEFNDKFNLYVTDKLESHKIFTPTLIKEVVELEAKYDNIMTIFHLKNHLYIFLYDRKNQFEDVSSYENGIINDYQNQYQILEDYLKVFLKNI